MASGSSLSAVRGVVASNKVMIFIVGLDRLRTPVLIRSISHTPRIVQGHIQYVGGLEIGMAGQWNCEVMKSDVRLSLLGRYSFCMLRSNEGSG